MAIGYTDLQHYSDIANAIREQNGESTLYKPEDMAAAIAAIEGGGGGGLDLSLIGKLVSGATATPGDVVVFPEECFAGVTSFRASPFQGVKAIPAFDLTFPDVTAIVGNCFRESNVRNVTFKKQIGNWTNSQSYAFFNCTKLESVTFAGKFAYGGLRVPNYSFSGCLSLASIPATLSATNNRGCDIGTGAFRNCTSFVNVTVPPSFGNIATNAFEGCSNMKTFDMSSVYGGITLIDGRAFLNCTSLETVRLGFNYQGYFGNSSNPIFPGCEALKHLILTDPYVVTLQSTKLFGTTEGYVPSSLVGIYVPDSSVNSFKTASNWSAFADYIKPKSECPV